MAKPDDEPAHPVPGDTTERSEETGSDTSRRGIVLLPDVESDAPTKLGKPRRRSMRASVREVVEARQILANFVKRDFSTQHRNSFLGLAWSLVNPLLLVLVFTLVFRIFRAAPQGDTKVPFALFFFAGLILWSLFASGLEAGTGTIVKSAYLIQKVYFPREILPMSSVLAALITFCFEFVVLLVVASIFGFPPDWHLLLAPIPVLTTVLFAYGLSLVLATANVYFRDVEHFLKTGIFIWFWSSAVIYDASLVRSLSPTAYRFFVLNPMVGIIDNFRRLVLGHAPPDWGQIAYCAAWAVALVVFGTWFFNRFEGKFAELI